MGILPSFDYGRKAEYLTSVFLSPYALTIPIRGHDDRFGSDFLCVGLDESDDSCIASHADISPSRKRENFLVPNLRLLFWVQTKSDVDGSKNRIEIESPSTVTTILKNKMPYYIAIVDSRQPPPRLSLYATSERIAFMHMHPYPKPLKIHFVPGFPEDGGMYRSEPSKELAIIYMGNPILEFRGEDSLDRTPERWEILKSQVKIDRFNFMYATVGLGSYRRKKRKIPPVSSQSESILDYSDIEEKIFCPTGGALTLRSKQTIFRALKMLEMTRGQDRTEIDEAIKILLKELEPELSIPIYGSPAMPEEDEEE